MAYELTDRAFKLTLPHIDKMVLANLARYADHAGKNARPGIHRQQHDLTLSSRTIERALRRLEDTHHLIRDSQPKFNKQGGRKYTVNYTLRLENWSKFEPAQDEGNPVSVTGFNEETPSLCHENPVTVSQTPSACHENPVSVTGEPVLNLSENLSINPSPDEDGSSSGKDAGMSRDRKLDLTKAIEKLEEQFAGATGHVLGISKAQGKFFAGQIREHGFAVVKAAVANFAQEPNNWDVVKRPAALLQSKWPGMLAVAKRELHDEAESAWADAYRVQQRNAQHAAIEARCKAEDEARAARKKAFAERIARGEDPFGSDAAPAASGGAQ